PRELRRLAARRASLRREPRGLSQPSALLVRPFGHGPVSVPIDGRDARKRHRRRDREPEASLPDARSVRRDRLGIDTLLRAHVSRGAELWRSDAAGAATLPVLR